MNDRAMTTTPGLPESDAVRASFDANSGRRAPSRKPDGRDLHNRRKQDARAHGLPPAQGMYDPALERDACGIGFVANIKNVKSHDIVVEGLEILKNLTHRG